MLKIKEGKDLKELEQYGFYLEGNTYKKDVGKHKCIAICYIDRKIIKPRIGKWEFKIKDIVENTIFIMTLDGLVEKV